MTNEPIVQPINTFRDQVLIAVVGGMVASGYRDAQTLAKEAFDIVEALMNERQKRAQSRYGKK